MLNAIIRPDNVIKVSEYTVSDSIKYEKVKFVFHEDWNGYIKTVVFTHGDIKISVILNQENELCTGQDECYIPFEVIKAPFFSISVFGTLGESRITTSEYEVKVIQSGYGEGAAPSAPTPSEYQQLIEAVQNTESIAQSVRDDADNGVFNGEKGDNYVLTEADKQEIVDNTLNSPEMQNAINKAEKAEQIAKGKASGYVFDTIENLDLWLADKNNTSLLNLGDNLYIRDTDVPDYWWDGETKQPLETQKVNLTDYALKSELPTKTSDLTNDNNFATEDFVDNKIIPNLLTLDWSENMTIQANNEYSPVLLQGETSFNLGDGLTNKANTWIFSIKQGETAHNVTLPDVKWTLGIAPTFSANTITTICLYYVENELRGDWNC